LRSYLQKSLASEGSAPRHPGFRRPGASPQDPHSLRRPGSSLDTKFPLLKFLDLLSPCKLAVGIAKYNNMSLIIITDNDGSISNLIKSWKDEGKASEAYNKLRNKSTFEGYLLKGIEQYGECDVDVHCKIIRQIRCICEC